MDPGSTRPTPPPPDPTADLDQARRELDDLRRHVEANPGDAEAARRLHRQHYVIADLERKAQAQIPATPPGV